MLGGYYIAIHDGTEKDGVWAIECWHAYQVPRDVYVYIKQLENYIKNPKKSKLKKVYDRRFKKEK